MKIIIITIIFDHIISPREPGASDQAGIENRCEFFYFHTFNLLVTTPLLASQ